MDQVQKILFRASLSLLTFASANAQQNVAPQPPKVRSEPVVLTVTVTDKNGQFIRGLEQNNFEVLENKVAQTIASFSDLGEPASVGILFDASGSMAGSSGSTTRQQRDVLASALARFLELSNPSNEYFVVGFSSEAWLPLEWTSDRQAVIDKFGSSTPKGQTALYDACYAGIQKVMEGRYHKQVILLISDGQDNSSRHTFGQLRELLKQSNILFYAVGVLGGSDPSSSLGMESQGILDEFGVVSGGEAFFLPRPGSKIKDAYAIFEGIAEELNTHYTISFQPAASTGKKTWHKIKVKVSPPANAKGKKEQLYLRTREGYYQY